MPGKVVSQHFLSKNGVGRYAYGKVLYTYVLKSIHTSEMLRNQLILIGQESFATIARKNTATAEMFEEKATHSGSV